MRIISVLCRDHEVLCRLSTEIKNSPSISKENGIDMLLLRRLQLLSPLLFPSVFSIPALLFIAFIIASALGE